MHKPWIEVSQKKFEFLIMREQAENFLWTKLRPCIVLIYSTYCFPFGSRRRTEWRGWWRICTFCLSVISENWVICLKNLKAVRRKSLIISSSFSPGLCHRFWYYESSLSAHLPIPIDLKSRESRVIGWSAYLGFFLPRLSSPLPELSCSVGAPFVGALQL